MATMATMATKATRVSTARRVSRRGSSGHRVCARARARSGEEDGDVEIAPVSGRRALLFAAGAAAALTPRASQAADIGSVSLSSAAVNEPLKPLAEYTAALERAASELAEIAETLAEASGVSADARPAPETEDDPSYFDDPELSVAAPLSAKARDALKARLHSGELGRFWASSRGADRYLASARSSFARDREDLWKLLPEKSGPLGRLLRPDFDNPDDPLCLIYSCVNDPRAPPSIDVLYALKLLDEGLATAGVTAPGLAGNCQDAADKLSVYRALVAAEADATLEDAEWRNPAPAKGWGRVGI